MGQNLDVPSANLVDRAHPEVSRKAAGFAEVLEVAPVHEEDAGLSRFQNKRAPSFQTLCAPAPGVQSRSDVLFLPGNAHRTSMAANQLSLGCIPSQDMVVAYRPTCHICPRRGVACLDIWVGCWAGEEERRRPTYAQGLSRDLPKRTCVAHGMSAVCRIAVPQESSRAPVAMPPRCLVDRRVGFGRGYAVDGKGRTRRRLTACAVRYDLVVQSLGPSQEVRSSEDTDESAAVSLWLDLPATTISTWSPQQARSVLLS